MRRRIFFGFAAAPLAATLLTAPQDTSKLPPPKPEIAPDEHVYMKQYAWKTAGVSWMRSDDYWFPVFT